MTRPHVHPVSSFLCQGSAQRSTCNDLSCLPGLTRSPDRKCKLGKGTVPSSYWKLLEGSPSHATYSSTTTTTTTNSPRRSACGNFHLPDGKTKRKLGPIHSRIRRQVAQNFPAPIRRKTINGGNHRATVLCPPQPCDRETVGHWSPSCLVAFSCLQC